MIALIYYTRLIHCTGDPPCTPALTETQNITEADEDLKKVEQTGSIMFSTYTSVPMHLFTHAHRERGEKAQRTSL